MNGSSSNKFAFYVAAGRILAMLAQFVIPVFLTRYLSKSDYGLYAQFYLLLTFLGTILCFGIQSNLYYFFPKYPVKKHSNLVWNNIIIMTLSGCLGMSIFAIAPIRNILLGTGGIDAYWNLIALCIILYIPTNLISTLAVVKKDKGLATFYPPIDISLKIAIIIPIAIIFKSMYAIFIGIVMLQTLQCAFIYGYVIHYYGYNVRGIFNDLSLIKEQLSYALPFGGAVIISTICQRLDKIVCVSYLTESEYAIYSLAFFGIPGIMQIYDSIVQVNVTNMSKAYANEDKNEVLKLYRDFVRQTLSFSLPLILIGIVFANQFIEFAFSANYIATVPYFRIYLLTFIIAMIGCGTILRAVGRTKQSFNAFLISGLIYIPICILLIRYFGINGAITAAVIGVCLPRFIQTIFELRWSKVSIRKFLPWRDISKIAGWSILLLLPIVLINQSYHIGLFTAILITLTYLLSTYTIQIRYDIFIVSKQSIINRIKHHLKGA